MNIQLNGETKVTTSTNLLDVLVEFGFADAKVATAINGEFIPVGLRKSTQLTEGDRLEVLAPMQGG